MRKRKNAMREISFFFIFDKKNIKSSYYPLCNVSTKYFKFASSKTLERYLLKVKLQWQLFKALLTIVQEYIKTRSTKQNLISHKSGFLGSQSTMNSAIFLIAASFLFGCQAWVKEMESKLIYHLYFSQCQYTTTGT